MDLDPNYDPSDFLTMHSRIRGTGAAAATETSEQHYQSSTISQFLPQDEDAHQESAALTNQEKMTLSENMGINNDLGISESDDDDDNARPKKEGGVFTNQMEEDIAGVISNGTTHNMMVGIPQHIQQQLSAYDDVGSMEQQQQQPEDQPSQDDNNDDDWLRF